MKVYLDASIIVSLLTVTFAGIDQWTATFGTLIETTAADIATAAGFIRRLDLTLRAPDAINIAIAQRLGIALATFDIGMAACAATLGLAVAPT